MSTARKIIDRYEENRNTIIHNVSNTHAYNKYLSNYHTSYNDEVSKHTLKTGTTICGLITNEGIVLAADTRATAGQIVADKNCLKLRRLYDSIWCAGAGTAADLEHVTKALEADLKLFSAQLKNAVRVEVCVHRLASQLYKYRGYISVALIIGGINPSGKCALWYVSPHGYTHSLPYLAMGSGGYFAQSILEDKYIPELTLEEGVELAVNAISAGILNDLGSGSNVDVIKISLKDPMNPIMQRAIKSYVESTHVEYNPNEILNKFVVLREESKQINEYESNTATEYLI